MEFSELKDKISSWWAFPCCACLLPLIIIVILVAALGATWSRHLGDQSLATGNIAGGEACLEYPANANPDTVTTCIESWIASNTSSRSIFRKSEGGKSFARLLTDSAIQFRVNPALMLAIGMHESAGGTSLFHKNNYFGWDAKDFNSLRSATITQGSGLRRIYLDKGLTTIESIGAIYAPIGAANDPTGLNKDWVPGVTRFFNSITGNCPTLQCSPQLAAVEGCLNVPYYPQMACPEGGMWCGKASQIMVKDYLDPGIVARYGGACGAMRHFGYPSASKVGHGYAGGRPSASTIISKINASLNKKFPVIYFGGRKFSRGHNHHIFVITGYSQSQQKYCANNTYGNQKNVFSIRGTALTPNNLVNYYGPQSNGLIYHP